MSSLVPSFTSNPSLLFLSISQRPSDTHRYIDLRLCGDDDDEKQNVRELKKKLYLSGIGYRFDERGGFPLDLQQIQEFVDYTKKLVKGRPNMLAKR